MKYAFIALMLALLMLMFVAIFSSIDNKNPRSNLSKTIDFKNVANKVICKSPEPLSVYLNFYGDARERWIVILFGRDHRDIELVFIEPSLENGIDFSTYVATKQGYKQIHQLNELEKTMLSEDLVFSKDEKEFLESCVKEMMTMKFKI